MARRQKRTRDPLTEIFGPNPKLGSQPAESKPAGEGAISREAVLFGDLPAAAPGHRPADKAAMEQHQHELDQLPTADEDE